VQANREINTQPGLKAPVQKSFHFFHYKTPELYILIIEEGDIFRLEEAFSY